MQYISKIIRAANFLVIVLSYTPCLKPLIKWELSCGMWNAAVFLCKLPSYSSRTFSSVATTTVSYGHSYGRHIIVACVKMKHSLLHSLSRMIRVCFGGCRNMHGRKFWYGCWEWSELDFGTMISWVGSNEPNFLMPNLGDERKQAQTELESGCGCPNNCYNRFPKDEMYPI